MTIAISLKINDGLVLAADSASTVMAMVPGQQTANVINVYNNANKIFNLYKGLPIGAITWGGGAIGAASIATIVKDLRDRFSGKNAPDQSWIIAKDKYTIEHVAKQFRSFVYEELYQPAMKDAPGPPYPEIGFIVAGYSTGGHTPEEYSININADGSCGEPVLMRKAAEVGATWAGQPEALNRLLMGHGSDLSKILQNSLGVPAEQIGAVMGVIQQSLQIPVIVAPMPLQDAIDLAEFMVETTIKYTRFIPGPSTVGGPIEIAAISKHEGFRWVRRKYYFPLDLNPTEISYARNHAQFVPDE
jgi:hypothetical protein